PLILSSPRDLRPDDDAAVLLFSGGFDSTLVALLLRQYGIPTIALTVNYRTRPQAETAVARELARHLDFRKRVDVDPPVGDFRYEPDRWPSPRHEAWMPFRKVMFYSLGAYTATMHGYNVVAAGTRIWDGPDFDDATLEHMESLAAVFQRAGCDAYSNRI